MKTDIYSIAVHFLETVERGHWTTSGNFKMMNKQGPDFLIFSHSVLCDGCCFILGFWLCTTKAF